MRTLVSMGRGGTGKTSFIALTAKHFIEEGVTPLLLVDADPDQNLAEMVGVDLEEEGRKTICEIVIETFIEGGGTLVGVSPSERLESRIWSDGLYEGEYFDLLALGTKWVEGCYCLPDAALKKALESIAKAYQFVLVDCPAGLEHLNRRITTKVDSIFDIIDPSQKSFRHVERAYRVAKDVDIQFNHFYVVAGFRFPESLTAEIQRRLSLPYLGKIAYDPQVEQYVLAGKSLLDLPSSSPAYLSVKRILKSAGY